MWYYCRMDPQGGAVAPFQPGGAAVPVVSPTAIASGKSTAVFAFADVLKTVVHALPMAFHSESGIEAADAAIDAYVGAHVPASEMSAILTGDERAPKEDVSLRIPPGGGVQGQVLTGPVLDYAKLARAILMEQAKMQQKAVEGSE